MVIYRTNSMLVGNKWEKLPHSNWVFVLDHSPREHGTPPGSGKAVPWTGTGNISLFLIPRSIPRTPVTLFWTSD